MGNIFQSFELHKTLNPNVWLNTETNDFSLIKPLPDIRKKLLGIVDLFMESIKINGIGVDDIVLVGSITNYNWSKYSDIDLHIMIDKRTIPMDAETLDDYFNVKKQLFNSKHELTIKNFDTEVYLQGVDEPNASSGIFSLMRNEWVKEPKRSGFVVNKGNIKKKIKTFLLDLYVIEQMINENETPDKILVLINKLKDKIKKYRKSGLTNGGEYSDENLVFKYLRRTNYLQKLSDYKIETVNQMFSLNELNIKSLQ